MEIGPPHSRCNFISEDNLFLVGARPESFTIEALKKFGITVFVNLEVDPVSSWYVKTLSPGCEYYNVKIKPGGVPSQKDCGVLIDELIALHRERKKVYIHCSGGHGRSGTICAVLLGKMNGWDAAEAIQEVERWRETRLDKSRNFVPTPENGRQVAFVVKILGLKEGHVAPSREDKSWLRKVENERKRKRDAPHLDSADRSDFVNKIGDPLLVYNGLQYASSEHAFQAAKFLYDGADADSCAYGELVRLAATPNQARVLACQRLGGGYPWRVKLNEVIQQFLELGVRLRPDWDSIRDDVMREILSCKFCQDGHCREKLLSTGDFELVEHTSRDSYWGDGGDGTGCNKLGQLLMDLRSQLRNEDCRSN